MIMKVLLYSEGMKFIAQSGVGRAIKHQMKALELNNIDYTTDPNDDFDVVHINTTGPMSIYLAKRAKKQGKKVIMHAHSTEEDFRDSFFFANTIAPLFKKEIVYAYSQADELVTPTPYAKQVIDSYNIGLECTPVSNGIDLSKFVYNREQAQAFRKEYGFSSTDKIILSVGLQIKRKGILDFIELANRMPDYQFVWCGHTSPWLMTGDVKKAIASCPDNVHMLGYVTNMVGAYSACDTFLMATKEETEGIVVLEALSMKRPVIIRDIPVYEEWLEDGLHCHKAHDLYSFERTIEDVIENRLNDTTEAGYIVAQERSLSTIGEQLEKIYTR